MKTMESKSYITSRGVETYEYGIEFDFDNDFKVGDKVLVHAASYSINYEYVDRYRFYIDTIKEIDKEKETIILSNGVKYKQAFYTNRLIGYKDIEKLDYFKAIREPEWINGVEVYDTNYNTIKNGSIHPKYFFLYTKAKEQEINKFIEKVKKLDIERKAQEDEKTRKQNVYNKYQELYNKEIEETQKKLEEMKKELKQKELDSFNKCFCQNCKYGNLEVCPYEEGYKDYGLPITNHTYKYEGVIYPSRPYSECKQFEEKER